LVFNIFVWKINLFQTYTWNTSKQSEGKWKWLRLLGNRPGSWLWCPISKKHWKAKILNFTL
jgi:hypothetical protein